MDRPPPRERYGKGIASSMLSSRLCYFVLLPERLQGRILWIYRKRNFSVPIINMPTTDNNRLNRHQRLGFEENSDLLERAKLGEVNAFDRRVGPYERGLFLVILRITKHREDAEDVMQEALLRAYTNIKTFRGESRFNTWLTRIGINQAMMCLRARRRPTISLDYIPSGEDSITLDLPDCGPNPEQHCGDSELELTLHRLINTLPSAFRSVVVTRYLQEMSVEETANSLGLSVAATKSRLTRARRYLQRRLGRR
jgi:RNA polymerase sigma-70 factor, ECF subfamily